MLHLSHQLKFPLQDHFDLDKNVNGRMAINRYESSLRKLLKDRGAIDWRNGKKQAVKHKSTGANKSS